MRSRGGRVEFPTSSRRIQLPMPWRPPSVHTMVSVPGARDQRLCGTDAARSKERYPTGQQAPTYAFSVDVGTGATEFLESELHGYPAALDAVLDDVARGNSGGLRAGARRRDLAPATGDRHLPRPVSVRRRGGVAGARPADRYARGADPGLGPALTAASRDAVPPVTLEIGGRWSTMRVAVARPRSPHRVTQFAWRR